MTGYYLKIIRETQRTGRKANREAGKPASEKRTGNPCGKTRPVDKPYATWTAHGFYYMLLKSYQSDNGKEYARWFVNVVSPYTSNRGELGDCYVKEALSEIDYSTLTVDGTIWPYDADYEFGSGYNGKFVAWAFGEH
jgi:hypothetical protein